MLYYFSEHASFRGLFVLTPVEMTHKTNRRRKKPPTPLGVLFLVASLLTALPGTAQTPGKAPTLSIAAVPLTTAQRTSQTMVNLNFRVPSGYHINSNTPKSEFLIPTALKMDVPTDIVLGKIEYPAGEDRKFPFLTRRNAECV